MERSTSWRNAPFRCESAGNAPAAGASGCWRAVPASLIAHTSDCGLRATRRGAPPGLGCRRTRRRRALRRRNGKRRDAPAPSGRGEIDKEVLTDREFIYKPCAHAFDIQLIGGPVGRTHYIDLDPDLVPGYIKIFDIKRIGWAVRRTHDTDLDPDPALGHIKRSAHVPVIGLIGWPAGRPHYIDRDPDLALSPINLDTCAKPVTKASEEVMAAGGDMSRIGQLGVGVPSAYRVLDKVRAVSMNNDDDVEVNDENLFFLSTGAERNASSHEPCADLLKGGSGQPVHMQSSSDAKEDNLERELEIREVPDLLDNDRMNDEELQGIGEVDCDGDGEVSEEELLARREYAEHCMMDWICSRRGDREVDWHVEFRAFCEYMISQATWLEAITDVSEFEDAAEACLEVWTAQWKGLIESRPELFRPA